MIDQGVGIQEGDKTKLFKLFGCIQDEEDQINTKGIGLGLVISKLIVNHFGGDIRFESKVGEGSKFSFNFMTEPLESELNRPSRNPNSSLMPFFDLKNF